MRIRIINSGETDLFLVQWLFNVAVRCTKTAPLVANFLYMAHGGLKASWIIPSNTNQISHCSDTGLVGLTDHMT